MWYERCGGRGTLPPAREAPNCRLRAPQTWSPERFRALHRRTLLVEARSSQSHVRLVARRGSPKEVVLLFTSPGSVSSIGTRGHIYRVKDRDLVRVAYQRRSVTGSGEGARVDRRWGVNSASVLAWPHPSWTWLDRMPLRSA